MSVIIDYQNPASHAGHFKRHPVWWLLIGPVMGGVLGIAQGCTVGAVEAIQHPATGPGLYISIPPMQLAEMASFMCGFCGALAGILFGVALMLFETLAARRAREGWLLLYSGLCIVATTAVFDWMMTDLILIAVLAALVTVVFGLILAMLTARRVAPLPDPRQKVVGWAYSPPVASNVTDARRVERDG